MPVRRTRDAVTVSRCAAASECQHRSSFRHGLDRDDSKVFFGCKYERPGGRHEKAQFFVRHEPDEGYIGTGQLSQPARLRSITGDNQFQIGHQSECPDDCLHVLVGHEPACSEKVVTPRDGRGPWRLGDRWINDARGAAVYFPNPSRYESRIGNHFVGAVGGTEVPHANFM
jgi:hypothetical protein